MSGSGAMPPPPVFLVVLALARPGAAPRQVSVWVRGEGADQARETAQAAMRDQGWTVTGLLDLARTDAEDYFRACPSQQAYARACELGLAWRFHDA